MDSSFLKNHLGLIGIIAILIFSFVSAAFFVKENGFSFLQRSSAQEIEQLVRGFKKENTPIAEINFSQIYGESEQFQVLHPLLGLKKLHLRNCNNCSETNTSLSEDPEVLKQKEEKRKILENSLYSSRPLPTDFFTQPPFTDQWGFSFANLVALYEVKDKDWIQNHLSFFKVSELKEVLSKYSIQDSRFLVLSNLDQKDIELVVKGESLILTDNYLLVKQQTQLAFSPLSYVVYKSADFLKKVHESRYDVDHTAIEACVYRLGNSCWSYNSRQVQAYFYRYSFVVFIMMGFIVFSFLGFYLKSLYEKSKAQAKHRLSLQVLSHEFRTPVSASLLLLEQLRHQSQLSEKDQDLLTRLSTEIFRLQRIIEVSKNYLQTESHRIQFKKVVIPSINQWMSDFIDETKGPIQFQPLQQDQSFEADPFWFKFVISNLVQNAFDHGESPVILKAENSKGDLKISVSDQGVCDFKSLDEMTEAFVKHHRSSGMGIGLNMILFVLKQWGAQLSFSKNPTTFTLRMKKHGANSYH